MTLTWLKAAGVRALKTFAQAAIGTIGATLIFTQVDWKLVLGVAGLAAVLSFLTSIAGLPEIKS